VRHLRGIYLSRQLRQCVDIETSIIRLYAAAIDLLRSRLL